MHQIEDDIRADDDEHRLLRKLRIYQVWGLHAHRNMSQPMLHHLLLTIPIGMAHIMFIIYCLFNDNPAPAQASVLFLWLFILAV